MDVRLSRAKTPVGGRDPHDWNTYDHYRTIHQKHLDDHSFVDHRRTDQLQFREDRGEVLLRGRVHCQHNIVLAVDHALEIRYSGHLLRVRPYRFRYASWVVGGKSVLRYHNMHADDDDYHHRVYNPRTGDEILYEALHRHQFPTFDEVLDELEIVATLLDEHSNPSN